MKSSAPYPTALFALLLLAGCASLPTAPSVLALPGNGKTFEQFRQDDNDCRQYARRQLSGAKEAANDAGVRSAAVGTVLGAVAGAAIGGRDGAAVGAGSGLLVGSMSGAGASQRSTYGAQRSYDNAYVQCMYAQGAQVPVAGGTMRSRAQTPADALPPPNGNYPPPPPPGHPPPPPPDAR